jgi:hypothetical protein
LFSAKNREKVKVLDFANGFAQSDWFCQWFREKVQSV